jgi:hypothetical protein
MAGLGKKHENLSEKELKQKGQRYGSSEAPEVTNKPSTERGGEGKRGEKGGEKTGFGV